LFQKGKLLICELRVVTEHLARRMLLANYNMFVFISNITKGLIKLPNLFLIALHRSFKSAICINEALVRIYITVSDLASLGFELQTFAHKISTYHLALAIEAVC